MYVFYFRGKLLVVLLLNLLVGFLLFVVKIIIELLYMFLFFSVCIIDLIVLFRVDIIVESIKKSLWSIIVFGVI